MTGWLQLTDEQRRATLAQAETASGIQAKAIEKDWWVTLTLQALFTSAHAPHIVFKGGTSLSKCWRLISRFSEDIDIALDPAAFEMEYREVPSRRYVKNLKREGCRFTTENLRQAIEERLLALGVPIGTVTIEAAPVPVDFPETDPQTLYVRYTSLYPPLRYIADEIKIEVSVRSLIIPFRTATIQSLLNEYFPNPVYGEVPFPVTAVEPHKTFLEKMFLLHEEFQKPDRARIRSERMSRHLYDLVSIMDTEAGTLALRDYALYDHIITHRKWYTGYSYLDYETLGHSLIDFIVPIDFLQAYEEDYTTMREEMIYRPAPSFNELMVRLKQLQGRVRVKLENRDLETIITDANNRLPAALKLQPDATDLQIPITYLPDPNHAGESNNAQKLFTVFFKRRGEQFEFERILL